MAQPRVSAVGVARCQAWGFLRAELHPGRMVKDGKLVEYTPNATWVKKLWIGSFWGPSLLG